MVHILEGVLVGHEVFEHSVTNGHKRVDTARGEVKSRRLISRAGDLNQYIYRC